MDRNHSAEASDGQCSGRVEVSKDRDSGPFPVAQTAEMFPWFWLLTIKGARE